jgi:hypothetical protein
VILKKILLHAILILLPFLVVEGVFRLLPVSSPPYILPVSSENPVAHFQPNVDYVFSVGWNFSIRTSKHSNNFGYNNLSDYDPDETTPLLMVMGDSYVEAHAVDAGKSAAEILNSGVDGAGRVYSIGLSGAQLSQYLVFADFARTTFRPDAMAFVIIGRDFDESLLKYMSDPRFHYFQESGDNFVLRRVDYELSLTKKLLRHSAFVRYVMLNLSAKETLERLSGKLSGQSQDYVGNMPTKVEEARVTDAKSAIDEFFRRLPQSTGLDNRSILFVIDGVRPALYSPEELKKAEDSYVSQMMRYFKEHAISRGYEVIDMQPAFIRKHRLDGSRFEFENDSHWNELGHRLVAEEIQKSAVFTHMFDHQRSAIATQATDSVTCGNCARSRESLARELQFEACACGTR